MVRIALDVDGVLADIISVWLEEYNLQYNKSLKRDEIIKWDFWRHFGYDPYRFYEELSRCWIKWERVPTMEDGIGEAVDKLRSIGSVDIVTARDLASTEYVKQWLKHNGITYNNYVSVTRGREKADLSYDVFIDDSPLNAESITSRGKRILLYDQPWNREVKGENIYRIRRLVDAVDMIQLIL